MIVHENSYGKFGYSRDTDGKGYWHCISGCCPGVLGKIQRGIIVPILYSSILTGEAMANGIASEAFNKPKADKKEKAVRVRANKKATVARKVFGG
jgi:hypothetical protein